MLRPFNVVSLYAKLRREALSKRFSRAVTGSKLIQSHTFFAVSHLHMGVFAKCQIQRFSVHDPNLALRPKLSGARTGLLRADLVARGYGTVLARLRIGKEA